jgi:large subunit ribosomal protein L6
MSRIGRAPITIPTGVKVHVADRSVRVEGPKGTLQQQLPDLVAVRVDGDTVSISRENDESRARGMHGLARKLVANMVRGVSAGFSRSLEISGVGYRADVKGRTILLTLGYSHPIVYQLPDGVTAKVEKQVSITLEGSDNQLLGQVAASLRDLRPPEPYKGKGIRYAAETIRRKAGKAGAGASS